MVVGRGAGGALAPWILEIWAKNGCFLVSSEKNFSPLLASLLEKFWKNPLVSPPGKNSSDAHGDVFTMTKQRFTYNLENVFY